jgi:poly-gamma-glutamate capsule biosynthesis protein CapA/YwtB (metallophosphatase superfamily)
MPLSVLLLLALSTQPATPAAPETAPSAEPTAATADPATAATDEQFARGIEALKAHDAKSAIAALSACVEAAPTRVDCRWELGWAYSLENKWAEALVQWAEVQKLKPDQPDLENALTQARAQAALQERLAKPPEPTERPAPPEDAKVRIRAVGDVMLGTTEPEGYLPPEGAEGVIAAVKPLLEDADVTFVNLEGPLCDDGVTKKCRSPNSCYAFRSPTSYGQALKDAGVDVASTANNHSGDYGEECRRQTEATLDKLGIVWSGPPGSVATLERNGLRIGMVAFHTSPSCNHLNNLPTAKALVRSVAASHDLVLVSFHGGAEGSKATRVPHGTEKFMGENRGDLRAFTHAMVDAGAHLVMGHGPHVARAMEFYKGRLIAYSMGNFATYGRFTVTGIQGLGMVLEVELDREGRFLSGRILPTRQHGEGIPQPDPQGGVISLVRKLTAQDFPATGAQITEDGVISPRGKPSMSSQRSTP